MSDVTGESAGFLLKSAHAWWFLGAWFVAVLVHGFWRSIRAEQDAIRPSGPIE
jgi:hypothetical protein